MTQHWTPINYAAVNALCLSRFDSLPEARMPSA